MPRLFVGLKIPSDIAFDLSLKKGGLLGSRWIDQENYHITLRFIGDIDDRKADDVLDCLYHIDRPPFEISLGSLNFFAKRNPHSLWASVSPSMPLMALQSEIERVLRRFGIQPDSRKFTPHVTIARLRGARYEDVARYLGQSGVYQSPSYKVDEFQLFSSRNSIGGGPYLIEERFGLHDANAAFDEMHDEHEIFLPRHA